MPQVERSRVQRWRELLNSERDAAALYVRLAAAETGERRKIFEELAAIERRHAGHWGASYVRQGPWSRVPDGRVCEPVSLASAPPFPELISV